MEYKIVTAVAYQELVNIVNTQLREGWNVCGGPFVVPYRAAEFHFQQGSYEGGKARIDSDIGQALIRPRRNVTPPRRGSVVVKL
jgi:hypothetical protein